MEKSKLVICDLDGTLFDTRRVNYMAYREAIERAGLPVARKTPGYHTQGDMGCFSGGSQRKRGLPVQQEAAA